MISTQWDTVLSIPGKLAGGGGVPGSGQAWEMQDSNQV